MTQLVTDAFRRYLGDTPTHNELARVRERCSFHLLCPMLETYFFGEPAALERAGATRPANLDPSNHLEDFLVVDFAFLGPDHVREHPWRRADRGRHPKRYLSFLVDPDDQGLTAYKESRDGVRALEVLDWAQVFQFQPPGITFAHSLFDDLADALGVPNPFPGTCHSLTTRRPVGRCVTSRDARDGVGFRRARAMFMTRSHRRGITIAPCRPIRRRSRPAGSGIRASPS